MLKAIIDGDNEDKAIVLAFYGVGNGPQKEAFYQLLERGRKKGIEMVIISQCQKGHIDSRVYEAGNYFAKLDLINGSDMTTEAAVTKLAYLMGKGLRGKELKEQFCKNLRGEQTPLEEIQQRVVKIVKKIRRKMDQEINDDNNND